MLSDAIYYFDNDFTRGQGFGIGMGMRNSTGKIYVDVNFKLQIWSLEDKPILDLSPDPTHTKIYTPFGEDGISFRTIGPGAIFAPSFIFGFSF